MSDSAPSSHSDSWLRKAKSTAKCVNLAWWLQNFNLPLTVIAILSSAIILTARYYEKLPSYFSTIAILTATIAIAGLLVWLYAKRRFEKPEESLVRIEEKMKLRNALSAAKAGVAPWPAPQPEVDNGLKWHLPRTLLPTLGSIAIIVASFFIPIGSYAETIANTPAPSALNDIESKLEMLKDEEIVQEDYIEDMEEKVEEIKQQDPAEWFSHSSLEAIDNLRENHDAAAGDMKENLKNAERALQSLQKHGDKLDQATKENLLNEFGKAVENLDTGNMKPNKELLDQLKKLDPNLLDQLTPEQLDQLRKNMREMAEKLKAQQGEGDGNEGEDGDGEGSNGDGAGGDEESESDGTGKGGLGRGPGHAPGLLGKEADKLGLGDAERLEPQDLKDTLPGDLLETTDGEHEIDKTDAKIRGGGNTENIGDGGERVWKNSLLPDEKKALKNFFK